MRKRRRRKSPLPAVTLFALMIVLAAVVLARIGAGDGTAGVTPAGQTAAPEATETPQEANEQIASKLVIPEISTPPTISWAETQESSQVTEDAVVDRYAAVAMTEEERRELAETIYHEAANQSPEGQQAVAEVVLNRVIASNFPSTVSEVIHDGEGTAYRQFSTVGLLGTVEPTQAQYDAIDAALYGPSILPDDVVFFSRGGENDRVWGQIGDHIFCRQYIWE